MSANDRPKATSSGLSWLSDTDAGTLVQQHTGRTNMSRHGLPKADGLFGRYLPCSGLDQLSCELRRQSMPRTPLRACGTMLASLCYAFESAQGTARAVGDLAVGSDAAAWARLGFQTRRRPSGPVLWFHALSLSEGHRLTARTDKALSAHLPLFLCLCLPAARRLASIQGCAGGRPVPRLACTQRMTLDANPAWALAGESAVALPVVFRALLVRVLGAFRAHAAPEQLRALLVARRWSTWGLGVG